MEIYGHCNDTIIYFLQLSRSLLFEQDTIARRKLIENNWKPDGPETRRIGILAVERCLPVHCLCRNCI